MTFIRGSYHNFLSIHVDSNTSLDNFKFHVEPYQNEWDEFPISCVYTAVYKESESFLIKLGDYRNIEEEWTGKLHIWVTDKNNPSKIYDEIYVDIVTSDIRK